MLDEESGSGMVEQLNSLVNDKVEESCLDSSVAEQETDITAIEGRVPSEGKDLEYMKVVEEIGPMGVGKDNVEFKKAVKVDVSLKAWRELANKGERGFTWKDGLLIKNMYVTWKELRDVIVLPQGWRSKILSIAHEKSGHLSGDKVSSIVRRLFLWPGIGIEIAKHCRSCVVCQHRNKSKPNKVPIVERPVLSEPFEDVAIDIVGPLPKSRGGCRYILTYLCLAMKWPEAIPLRAITAKAVAEGLWEIFTRTSILERILSDQGT